MVRKESSPLNKQKITTPSKTAMPSRVQIHSIHHWHTHFSTITEMFQKTVIIFAHRYIYADKFRGTTDVQVEVTAMAPGARALDSSDFRPRSDRYRDRFLGLPTTRPTSSESIMGLPLAQGAVAQLELPSAQGVAQLELPQSGMSVPTMTRPDFPYQVQIVVADNRKYSIEKVSCFL